MLALVMAPFAASAAASFVKRQRRPEVVGVLPDPRSFSSLHTKLYGNSVPSIIAVRLDEDGRFNPCRYDALKKGDIFRDMTPDGYGAETYYVHRNASMDPGAHPSGEVIVDCLSVLGLPDPFEGLIGRGRASST